MAFTDNSNLKKIVDEECRFSESIGFCTKPAKLDFKGVFKRTEDFPPAGPGTEGVMCMLENGDTYICVNSEWTVISSFTVENNIEKYI